MHVKAMNIYSSVFKKKNTCTANSESDENLLCHNLYVNSGRWYNS